MSYTFNHEATVAFINAAMAVAKDGPVLTVNRQDLHTIAASVGQPFPRWFANTNTFREARGTFRVPTIAECEKLNMGVPMPGRRGRKPADPNAAKAPRISRPKQSSVNAIPASSTNVDVQTSTMNMAASVANMSDYVRADANNASMQAEAQKALGVDLVLGDSLNIPYMPSVRSTYVPWGHFESLKTIVASGHFLPVMIVGPSGNGKTDLCEQVCAAVGREYVRVNITNQTDEDDLLGGFRLINGDTKFSLGPIPLAMLRGAMVNLDEIDLGGPSLMCLQPVLEGKPLYLKKIGRYIMPAPGFTIVATANTKGRGDDGKYAHTTIMNEAMLERFALMFEQGWPDASIERQILARVLKGYKMYDARLVKHLVEFATVTRTNFEQQVSNDQIATRRLLHMCQAFAALGNIDLAVKGALARFDADVAQAMMNLWSAIHDPEQKTAESSSGAEPVEPATDA